jgi:hypothetical protein
MTKRRRRAAKPWKANLKKKEAKGSSRKYKPWLDVTAKPKREREWSQMTGEDKWKPSTTAAYRIIKADVIEMWMNFLRFGVPVCPLCHAPLAGNGAEYHHFIVPRNMGVVLNVWWNGVVVCTSCHDDLHGVNPLAIKVMIERWRQFITATTGYDPDEFINDQVRVLIELEIVSWGFKIDLAKLGKGQL